jgi:Fe-S-cluster containining protein
MIKWTNETLTDDIVEKSVEQMMGDLIKGHYEDWVKLKTRLDLVKMVYKADYTPSYNSLGELWEIRDAIVDVMKRHSCCREGCSWCCRMAVGITSLDAELIAKHTGIQPKTVVMDVNGLFKDRDEQIKKYMNVPCPFLRNGRCSIYEARPSACRTHFNVSKFPEVCNLEEFKLRDVPNIDLSILWVAEALICYKLEATMGDIRAYFPHVVEGKVIGLTDEGQ